MHLSCHNKEHLQLLYQNKDSTQTKIAQTMGEIPYVNMLSLTFYSIISLDLNFKEKPKKVHSIISIHFADSDDTDVVSHNVAFYQGLCSLQI